MKRRRFFKKRNKCEEESMSSKKQQRQALILDIIANETVNSQDGLMRALNDAGVQVTQATVSRDLNELRLVRQLNQQGELTYQSLETDIDDEHFQLNSAQIRLITSIEVIEFMIVVKTANSNGNRVAALIDEANFEQIVGTLAGHDTIFVMTHSAEEAKVVSQQMQSWL